MSIYIYISKLSCPFHISQIMSMEFPFMLFIIKDIISNEDLLIRRLGRNTILIIFERFIQKKLYFRIVTGKLTPLSCRI